MARLGGCKRDQPLHHLHGDVLAAGFDQDGGEGEQGLRVLAPVPQMREKALFGSSEFALCDQRARRSHRLRRGCSGILCLHQPTLPSCAARP